MKKILLKLIRLAALLYGLLFLVFYFDLDGKLLYYVWEPLMTRRYDKMKRKDNTTTPYEMKENVAG
ncbi:MAG: hypothetical protein IJ121_11735 [Eubacterium sp.]|nr:hypothetical protein [Eubacterium sp.]